MLDEFKDRIEHAKNKQYMLMDRFHIGDTVYPFWLKNFIVYGTVIDIDTVARKIICDFNGISRQFCPQDLMLVNPVFVQANKSKTASVKANKDADNGIKCKCKDCGGQIAVSYNEKEGKTDFVCTSCGKRIPEDKVSKKTKKAMRKACMKSASVKIDDVKDLQKLLRKTLGNVENGEHCWCQLPSGNWFCGQGVDGEKGLSCCIVDHIDTMGYPFGKIIEDLGSVTEQSDCIGMAKYTFDCDTDLTDENITNAKIACEILSVSKDISKLK